MAKIKLRIKIDEKNIITADAHNWILNGKYYFPSLDILLNDYITKKLRESNATSISQLIDELRTTKARVIELLAPLKEPFDKEDVKGILK